VQPAEKHKTVPIANSLNTALNGTTAFLELYIIDPSYFRYDRRRESHHRRREKNYHLRKMPLAQALPAWLNGLKLRAWTAYVHRAHAKRIRTRELGAIVFAEYVASIYLTESRAHVALRKSKPAAFLSVELVVYLSKMSVEEHWIFEERSKFVFFPSVGLVVCPLKISVEERWMCVLRYLCAEH
jgi:hypothetical protein